MKKHLPNIILIIVFLTGLSLLLYPTVSDWWNSFHQSRVIIDYTKDVEDLDNKTYEKMLSDARDYNKKLLGKQNGFVLSDEEIEEYNSLLDITGTGVMGYIEIPKIKVSLPIYHGTSEAVLSDAIGHIEGSSLPVGGESTHSILSGHRGLPSAKLFSNLDQLAEGDTFFVHTLNETLAYEVDRICTVEPDELSDLTIEEGKDYCTLVTCTPYGINTHRLLVRGHRIENADASAAQVTPDAVQAGPAPLPLIIAALIILVLIILLIIKSGKKKSKER